MVFKKHTEKTKQRLRECRLNKPRGTKIGKNIICEICGKEFYVMPYLEKQKKTCSKECFKIFKSNQAKELGYGKWMKGRGKEHFTKKGLAKLRKIGLETENLKVYVKDNGAWNKGLELNKENYPNFGWRTSRKKQILPIKDTTIEVKIQNFLKQLGIEFFTHQYIKEIEHGYQCDILIPSMNLVIECDGTYWHKYPIGREIDHIRTKELIEKGFKVLRLWECEINSMTIKQFEDILE